VYAAFIRAMRPIREGAQPNRPADVDAIRSALEEVVRGLDPRPDETLRREIEETMRRVEAVLGSGWTRPGPEALALMEEAPQRAIGAMAEIEEAILEQRARAIMGILEAMRGEVEEPARTRLREAASELKRMVREEYPRGRDADRSAWPQTVQRWWDGLRDGIHPDRVTIVERWHSPVLASLAPYDIFFLTASILLPLVVGPLRWVWLGRIRARRHRARIGAAIVLVPSALLAAGWAWKVPEQFETSSFREEIEAGNVIVRWALWPPHRWHYRDIVPMDEQAIRTKREHGGALPPSREHPLGTDMLDRDLLARLLWGGRISLTVGFVSASIALAIGTVLGALAGYYKGWVDNVVISRLTEWFMCFPVFFVVITMAAYTNNNMYVIMATIGALSWMGIQRLVRGEFLRLGNQDFVAAARALGAGNMRIMFRHILPNGLGPALIAASFGVASAILVESALGYLGFGVREPTPSWGSILNQMREARAWWVAVAPGFMIFLTVTAYNLVGDGIRDAIDPRLKT
jgi:peptide/nickel transport system permease protein